ncbi:hypothetical protein [uncultured Amnibacterium sp.]|uniref:hypothetical protein n=1 Tax=uncultured Amnibacterium sp. TaxID=1631851 RepID=UPI0035CAB5AB
MRTNAVRQQLERPELDPDREQIVVGLRVEVVSSTPVRSNLFSTLAHSNGSSAGATRSSSMHIRTAHSPSGPLSVSRATMVELSQTSISGGVSCLGRMA